MPAEAAPEGAVSPDAAAARQAWRRSRIRRWQPPVIAAIGHPLIAVLGRTWRWQVEGLTHYEAVQAGGRQPIMAFWHGRILPATYFFRHRGIVVMTSENFDGEWIARIIERFGYGAARGSSSHGATRALVHLRRALAAGRPAGFALDGPRGPARKAQPGAVWLAMMTGHPVLPFHLEADRCWTLRSWDRGQVPKPFSRVGLAVGAPIEVPSALDAEAREAVGETLTLALGALERRAAQLARQRPA